jgi:hypothetical protein
MYVLEYMSSRERNLHPFVAVYPRAASWFQRAPVVLIDNRTMIIVERDARVLQLQVQQAGSGQSLVQGGETQVDLEYCLASSSNPIM